MRSITRLRLSQQWSAPALEAITATKMDQHGGRGARAVSFARRQHDASEPEAIGGHGWTEHCPKCHRARVYAWRSAIQMQHSDACRARIELALEQTHRGRERLEHAKLRFDRRRAAHAAPQDDAQLESVGAEGELSGAGGPP